MRTRAKERLFLFLIATTFMGRNIFFANIEKKYIRNGNEASAKTQIKKNLEANMPSIYIRFVAGFVSA